MTGIDLLLSGTYIVPAEVKQLSNDTAIILSDLGEEFFFYSANYGFREIKETNIPLSIFRSIPERIDDIIIDFRGDPYLVSKYMISKKIRIIKKIGLAVYSIPFSLMRLIEKTKITNSKSDFVHLHVHTDSSILDGVTSCEKYVAQAKEFGMDALAVTDHGNMASHMSLHLACKKAGIKPIMGIEAYITDDATIHDGDHRSSNHIVLLAKNSIGYRNMLILQKLAWSTENYYYRPRIDYQMLEQYKDGLIVLTACLKGVLASKLINGKIRKARAIAQDLKDMFKDDLYFELQLHDIYVDDINIQKRYNRRLIELADEMNIKTVITNDVHYLKEGGHEIQSKVMRMREKDSELSETYCDSIWFKSFKDIYETHKEKKHFSDDVFKSSVLNTLEVAYKCNHELETGGLKIPKISVAKFPGNKKKRLDELEYLKWRIKKGLKKRKDQLSAPLKEYKKRIDYEIDAFTKMGVISYIFIYDDLVRFLKKQGCLCSLRGSANGSVVLWLIGLSIVDPIKFKILFERFISPARIEARMADIDIDLDICHTYRDMAIDYLKKRYGEDRVCPVGSFGRTQLRSAIKNMARVEAEELNKKINDSKTAEEAAEYKARLESFSFMEINKITKLIGDENDITKIGEVSRWFAKNKDWYFKYVHPILNNRYAPSLHPAGIVVSPIPYYEWLPVRTNKVSKGKNDERVFTTQWENSHTSVEHLNEAGVMVMDILGVKTLSVIKDTFGLIKKRYGIKLNLEDIPLSNKKVYKTLSKGENIGFFQLGSSKIKGTLRNTKPDNIEDLIFLIAADRPGPIAAGAFEKYADRKNGREEIEELHPSITEITKDSMGVLVYSEHLMLAGLEAAGMSPIDSEKLRKIVKSKNPEEFGKFKEKFIEGFVKKWTKKVK